MAHLTVKQLAQMLDLPERDRLVEFRIHAKAPAGGPVMVECDYLVKPIAVTDAGTLEIEHQRYRINAEIMP